MKPNVKIVVKMDGKNVFEANVTALNKEAVKMICSSLDKNLDELANVEIAYDVDQCYGKAIEYVEPNFSKFE
jgi:tRNA(Met) C34 N-acetyltransferase TmcA